LLSFPAGKHEDQVDAMGLMGQLLDTTGRGRELPPPKKEESNAHAWGDHGRTILAEPDATQVKHLKSREPYFSSGVSLADNHARVAAMVREGSPEPAPYPARAGKIISRGRRQQVIFAAVLICVVVLGLIIVLKSVG